jgi:glutaryl-CoA dehydrogenase
MGKIAPSPPPGKAKGLLPMKAAAATEFLWDDPLDLEALLSEDERLIRDSARAYAQEK